MEVALSKIPVIMPMTSVTTMETGSCEAVFNICKASYLSYMPAILMCKCGTEYPETSPSTSLDFVPGLFHTCSFMVL